MTHEKLCIEEFEGDQGKLLNNLQGGRDTPKAAIKWVSPIHQRDTPGNAQILARQARQHDPEHRDRCDHRLSAQQDAAGRARASPELDVCSDPGASSVSGVRRLVGRVLLTLQGRKEIGHRQHQAQRFAYGGDKAKFVLVVRRSFGVFGIDNEERNAGMLRDCVSAP